MIQKQEKKYSVLVADDDRDDLRFLCEAIEKHQQFELLECTESGKNLIRFLEQAPQKPDIIITDMFMPLMTGEQAIEHLIARNQVVNFQIIVISTLIIPSIIEKFKEYANIDFIEKPTHPAGYDELPAKILQVLQFQN